MFWLRAAAQQQSHAVAQPNGEFLGLYDDDEILSE